MASVSPDQVLKFSAPTKEFLCSLCANTYGIEFLAFKIRDMSSGRVVFEVSKDAGGPPPTYPEGFDYNQLRTISYKFPSDFLRFKTVGTTLKFRVGSKEVRNFRMIERHYFKTKLMKSYDFNFDFCIPNSTNEWEAIYDLPPLSEAQVEEIVAATESSHSDSFYFVDGTLIMHNKAKYEYEKSDSWKNSTASTSATSQTHKN